MSGLPVCPIQVLFDEKWNIGKKEHLGGDSYQYLYKLDADAIYGDIVYDYIDDNFPDKMGSFNERESDRIHDRLVSRGLEYIPINGEVAERVKDFVKELFSELGITGVEFEVQYFNSLEDIEQQYLDKIVFKA